MEAKAVRLGMSDCDTPGCRFPGTHAVVLKGIGWLGGKYCEKHAWERAQAVNEDSKPPSEDA